jgi:polar amino acid transport system substrate-binding protein
MKKMCFIFTLVFVMILASVATAPAGTALDRIQQKGELVVGITGAQPPLNVTTKTGKIIGLDADLAKLIAMNLGVKVKFSPMSFSQLLPALEAGQVDIIISGMTMTPERNLKVAFVGPYHISGKGILTKTQNIASLQDAEGLNKTEFKVAALRNSTSQTFVEKAAPKASLVPTESYKKAIDLLFDDKIDALVADYPFCAFSAFRYRDKGLISGQAQLTFEPLGIAMSEDTLLINWMQNFMGMLEGSGQLKGLAKRWLQDGSWIKELP